MNQHRTAQARVVWASLFAGVTLAVLAAAPAGANTRCSRAMIFTTPGVTWNDVERFKPPTLLSLAHAGAVGSMSVHTDVSRPSYSSAFITMGAGARMPGLELRAPIQSGPRNLSLMQDIHVVSASDLRDLSQRNGYGARAGALAQSLQTPVVAIGNATSSSPGSSEGFAQWPLLAAMDPSGHVQYSAINTLESRATGVMADRAAVVRMTRQALSLPCATVIIDVGDLERAEQSVDRARVFPQALKKTDRILQEVSGFLDLRRDLLLVVSPTSPPRHTHLGIAIAAGAGFGAGNELESASTRRVGIVTAPDIAPTVLAHMHLAQPGVMNGQRLFDVPGAADPVATANELDRKAVFIDAAKPAMSWVFLGAELALIAAALIVMWLRNREAPHRSLFVELVSVLSLVVAALPVGTFVANLFPDVGLGSFGFIALCLSLSLGAVLLTLVLRGSWLQRLGLISGLSMFVIVLDLVTGAHLQLNSLLGDSPLIAGRFAGAGNNAFAILAATGVVVGTLIVWCLKRTRRVLVGVAILFAIIVVVDGAPQFGSDVGGVLALVPGFALTWFLLSGKRISPKAVAVGLIGAILAAGSFIAVDVSRPPDQRTHLGRFFEDIRTRGGSAFTETVHRKAASNLRQARSFQNLYRFLPAMVATLFFLFWPRRWWSWLGSREPVLRAGLVAALIVGLLGSTLNDSGISIFTTMLLFVAPMAILVRVGSPESSRAMEDRSWNR